MDIFNEYKGEWAVIETATGKYIGRILNDFFVDKYIEIQPVFDYMPRLLQNPDGGLAKDVLILPHDLCSTMEAKLTIHQYITTMLFRSMQDVDREQYEKAIYKGAEIAIQAKAIKSNIVLASRMPGISGQKII